MKTKTVTVATFNFFCRRVRAWMKLAGELGWTVHYSLEERTDCDAAIGIDFENRGLNFVLPTELEDTSRKTIDHSALHESVHVILAHLDWLANERYVSKQEVTDACETAVCKITALVWNLSKPQRSQG